MRTVLETEADRTDVKEIVIPPNERSKTSGQIVDISPLGKEVINTGTVPFLDASYNSIGLFLSEISLISSWTPVYESAILARIA